MKTITEAAFQALKNNDPDIENYPAQSLLKEHDVMHLVSHPAFDGDLTKVPAFIGTSLHDEVLVQITQRVLLDSRAIYDSDGSVIGLIPLHQKDEFKDEHEVTVSQHPLTIDEMRSWLVIFLEMQL